MVPGEVRLLLTRFQGEVSGFVGDFNLGRVSGRARFMPSADGTMMMLMAANVAVYMLWQKADATFMREHFTVSDRP